MYEYITEFGTSISSLSGQLICRTKAGTGNYWSHRNINKMFKEKCGRHYRKAFNRVTTEDGYTWNITQSKGWTAV